MVRPAAFVTISSCLLAAALADRDGRLAFHGRATFERMRERVRELLRR